MQERLTDRLIGRAQQRQALEIGRSFCVGRRDFRIVGPQPCNFAVRSGDEGLKALLYRRACQRRASQKAERENKWSNLERCRNGGDIRRRDRESDCSS